MNREVHNQCGCWGKWANMCYTDLSASSIWGVSDRQLIERWHYSQCNCDQLPQQKLQITISPFDIKFCLNNMSSKENKYMIKDTLRSMLSNLFLYVNSDFTLTVPNIQISNTKNLKCTWLYANTNPISEAWWRYIKEICLHTMWEDGPSYTQVT